MEETVFVKKRLPQEPKEVKKAETEPKKETKPVSEKIENDVEENDEQITENTIVVYETIWRSVVRIGLTLLIFGAMFYYFHMQDTGESQEERIQRVMREERLKHVAHRKHPNIYQ